MSRRNRERRSCKTTRLPLAVCARARARRLKTRTFVLIAQIKCLWRAVGGAHLLVRLPARYQHASVFSSAVSVSRLRRQNAKGGRTDGSSSTRTFVTLRQIDAGRFGIDRRSASRRTRYTSAARQRKANSERKAPFGQFHEPAAVVNDVAWNRRRGRLMPTLLPRFCRLRSEAEFAVDR